jgi:threonine/homoserine/homoserine lactone efflux protein
LDPVNLTGFLLATLALNFTPGPDMLYVTARSIGQGRRAGILSALGIGAGLLVHTTAATLGLSAAVRSSSWAFDVLRYAGGTYLVWMGALMLRRQPAEARLATFSVDPPSTVFRQGVITNVLNPKVGLFFLAFLPQFVTPRDGSVARQLMRLGLLFDLSGTTVNILVALAAASFRTVLPRARLAERLGGGVLVGLGLRVALVPGARS